MQNVKIRMSEGGRHWHLPDCDLAQDKDYIEVPLIEVLNGRYSPPGVLDERVAYRLCPGCRLRIEYIKLVVRK